MIYNDVLCADGARPSVHETLESGGFFFRGMGGGGEVNGFERDGREWDSIFGGVDVKNVVWM